MEMENEMRDALRKLQQELHESGELPRDINMIKLFTAFKGKAWLDDRIGVLEPRIMKMATAAMESIAEKYRK